MANKFGKKIQVSGLDHRFLNLRNTYHDELIKVKLENLRKRYYIKTRMVIDQLIEDYRPGLLEKPTSGFENIFNPF